MTGIELIGIDGGGSHTRGVRLGADGEVRARGTAGPSNPRAAGWEAAERSLAAVCAQLAAAGPARGALHVCAGLAGVGRMGEDPRATEMVGRCLSRVGLRPASVEVVMDALAALEAATLGQAGGVLIAGTGSIAMGQDAGGALRIVGGWGYLVGDEGSGYWLGREALRWATQQADGRRPGDGILRAVLQATDTPSAEAMLARVIGPPPIERERVVALAPQILRLAAEGDAGANALVDTAVQELVRLVTALWRNLNLPPAAPLGISGGLLEPATLMTGRLRAAVATALPGVPVGPLPIGPAFGAAVRAARHALGADGVRALADRLTATRA